MTASHPYTVGEVILKISDVHLALGGKQILKNLSVEIRDLIRPGHTMGQVVAMLGPSGIGKTQLFRIMAGLNKPDSGTATLGEPGRAVEPGLVGVVAQNYPLFAHRVVLGNLMLAGKQAGLSASAAREKAMGFLRRFGLEESAHKYPAELSGGMRQRVAIAQQFMCSENLLLLDEPFSGLDPLQLDRVIGLIREVSLAHEHNTIVIVTHDINAALRISDTIWVLGREIDAQGEKVPGAKVMRTYNLIDEGVAWKDDPENTPDFTRLYREIRSLFTTL